VRGPTEQSAAFALWAVCRGGEEDEIERNEHQYLGHDDPLASAVVAAAIHHRLIRVRDNRPTRFGSLSATAAPTETTYRLE
jgi:hypothetical protein